MDGPERGHGGLQALMLGICVYLCRLIEDEKRQWTDQNISNLDARYLCVSVLTDRGRGATVDGPEHL